MYNQTYREIQRRGLQQMKLIRKVSSKFTHELPVGRIHLLFEWFKGLRSAEELPFDNIRTVAGSGSNLAFKPARARQDTLREHLVNRLGR